MYIVNGQPNLKTCQHSKMHSWFGSSILISVRWSKISKKLQKCLLAFRQLSISQVLPANSNLTLSPSPEKWLLTPQTQLLQPQLLQWWKAGWWLGVPKEIHSPHSANSKPTGTFQTDQWPKKGLCSHKELGFLLHSLVVTISWPLTK